MRFAPWYPFGLPAPCNRHSHSRPATWSGDISVLPNNTFLTKSDFYNPRREWSWVLPLLRQEWYTTDRQGLDGLGHRRAMTDSGALLACDNAATTWRIAMPRCSTNIHQYLPLPPGWRRRISAGTYGIGRFLASSRLDAWKVCRLVIHHVR